MNLWHILLLPLLEVLLVGALSGLVGVLAVLNRRVFFAESVTHGVFPGAVLGVVIAAGFGAGHSGLSACLFAGAFLMCLPLAGLMGLLVRLPGISSQAAAGIVLTLGFALGYFLATWFQPLPLQVATFLTGSVLTVSEVDVATAGAALAALFLLMRGRGGMLASHCFDASSTPARMRRSLDGLMHAAIILAVVVVIPAVGTVLSIALIAAPAAGLKGIAPSLRAYTIAAPLSGALIGLAGLGIAVAADLSAGGTIAAVAGVFFLACVSLGEGKRIIGRGPRPLPRRPGARRRPLRFPATRLR